MTNAIARWHSHAPIGSDRVEQAYADRLEGGMQEMAIQLNQVCTVKKLNNLSVTVKYVSHVLCVCLFCFFIQTVLCVSILLLLSAARSSLPFDPQVNLALIGRQRHLI